MICLNEEFDTATLEKIRLLYEKSFPVSEKKPFNLMLKKRESDEMEFLAITDDGGEFLGLAIMVIYGDIVLLDYFAIEEKSRGRGVGGCVLPMLRKRYTGKRLILEIEDPDEQGAENTAERVRRLDFYRRAKMVNMAYRVRLFGVLMMVMCFDGEAVSYEEYHGVYTGVFTDAISKNIRLVTEG